MSIHNIEHGFKDYEHFINHNKKCIDDLDDNQTNITGHIINMIHGDNLLQCDEEDFVESKSMTIYYNINNKLVILQSR